MKLLEISSVKPMSPTKSAAIKKLLIKMEDFFQEIEKIGKNELKSEENVVSMLETMKEIFSEKIENFKSLDINDKLLLLAQNSFKSGLVAMNILKKSLRKEMTQEINNLLEKSGLICCLVA